VVIHCVSRFIFGFHLLRLDTSGTVVVLGSFQSITVSVYSAIDEEVGFIASAV